MLFQTGMAVLGGKPTVMGGYEKDATPRDQDRVIFYDDDLHLIRLIS